MAGPGICVLCLADTCASELHPVVNPVTSYGYLIPNMYLFIVDIANRVCDVVGPGFVSTSPAFMRSNASHPAGPHGRIAHKRYIGHPLLGKGGGGYMLCDSSTACRLCRLEHMKLLIRIPQDSRQPTPKQTFLNQTKVHNVMSTHVYIFYKRLYLIIHSR